MTTLLKVERSEEVNLPLPIPPFFHPFPDSLHKTTRSQAAVGNALCCFALYNKLIFKGIEDRIYIFTYNIKGEWSKKAPITIKLCVCLAVCPFRIKQFVL